MSAALDRFCSQSRALLRSGRPLDDVLPELADTLRDVLVDPAFVRESFADDTPPGQRILHHDPETDAYVLAHVQPAGKGGKPHSHGASWAIYGNVRGDTEMTEWRRVNGDAEDHAELEATETYRLGPGETRAYGPGVIHSTAHPDKAWVVRVTGTDLNSIPRYHFRPQRDKILARS